MSAADPLEAALRAWEDADDQGSPDEPALHQTLMDLRRADGLTCSDPYCTASPCTDLDHYPEG